jgi:hypothetical protein
MSIAAGRRQELRIPNTIIQTRQPDRAPADLDFMDAPHIFEVVV